MQKTILTQAPMVNVLAKPATRFELSKNRIYGFSLIELMITLTVASILIAIATPSFSAFLKNSRIQSQTDKLFAALSQTRQLAITNNTKGFLCRTRQNFDVNTLNCNTNSTSQLNWHDHNYMTYTIDNNNATQKARLATQLASGGGAPGSTLGALKINQIIQTASERKQQIKNFEQLSDQEAGLTINTNRRLFVIAFNSDGTLYNNAPITFAICDDRADPEDFGRYIEISQSGRIRTAKTDATVTANSCNP